MSTITINVLVHAHAAVSQKTLLFSKFHGYGMIMCKMDVEVSDNCNFSGCNIDERSYSEPY